MQPENDAPTTLRMEGFMTDIIAWPAELLSANISTLFSRLPLLDRAGAAVRSGFGTIESWWPFADGSPDPRDVDGFVESVLLSGARVASLNFYPGDRSIGERGLPAIESGVERLRSNLPIALDIAERIGCRTMNLLYGNAEPGSTPQLQARRAAEAAAEATEAAAERGIGVMVEPISTVEAPRYLVRTVEDVKRLIDAVAAITDAPLGLCYDLYHLYQEDAHYLKAASEDVGIISHVQLADVPGRTKPGSGRIDFAPVFGALWASGYRGYVGLEYRTDSMVVAPAADPSSIDSPERES